MNPLDMEPVAEKNLTSIVCEAAERFPDKPAVFAFRQSSYCRNPPLPPSRGEVSVPGVNRVHNSYWTYRALWKEIRAYAGFFRQHHLQAGQRVGLLLYNDLSFILSYFALLGLGVTVIPLNTHLTVGEIKDILADAGAQALISSLDFGDVLRELNVSTLKSLFLASPPSGTAFISVERPPDLVIYIQPDDSAFTECFPLPVDADTLAVLIYTSGTTGKPKGVMLTHHNILTDAMANAAVIEAVSDDRFITISPLYHVFGQTNVLITAFLSGASLVLLRKFSPKSVLEAIEQYQVTFMAAVPTMYQMMLPLLRGDRKYNLSSLRVCHSGAAPMPREIFRQIETSFGAPVQEGYGLSEASSIICSNPLHGPRKPGSVGFALPGLIVKVLDDHLEECPAGTVGEIHVQGEVLMKGYLHLPDETKKTLIKDKHGHTWLKTKDMAYRDEEGYLFIVDRKDDLINIGGVKVYPREIEEALYLHPAVDAAAVVGIPSKLYHEEIKAFIVLKEAVRKDNTPSAPESTTRDRVQELQGFLREHLADYKIPKYIIFLPELPKGPTGKILRKQLKQWTLNGTE